MTVGKESLTQQVRVSQFGAHVRQLRSSRHWSIYKLAERSGYSASTISRLERGQLTPSAETAQRLAQALELEPRDAERLTALADITDLDATLYFARIQEIIRRRESQAQEIKIFHWQVLPGLIQTPAYMRALFSATGIPESAVEEASRARARRREVLGNASVEIILSEYSLRSRVSSLVDHIEQLRFLIELSETERVPLGIFPLHRVVPFLIPSSFTLYDQSGVVFETNIFEFAAWEREAVDEMSAVYHQIREVSVFGQEMRDYVESVIADIRGSGRQSGNL